VHAGGNCKHCAQCAHTRFTRCRRARKHDVTDTRRRHGRFTGIDYKCSTAIGHVFDGVGSVETFDERSCDFVQFTGTSTAETRTQVYRVLMLFIRLCRPSATQLHELIWAELSECGRALIVNCVRDSVETKLAECKVSMVFGG
jgi:hypothetical protein